MNTNVTSTQITNQSHISALLSLLILGLIIVTLTGCSAHVNHRHGTPHHEPRSQISFAYHYYPDLHVYYDIHRHLYHYHHEHRGWIKVRILPAHIRIGGHRHHLLNSKHNTPWKLNHRYKHHRSHPARDQRKPQHNNHGRSDDQHNRSNQAPQRPKYKQHSRPDPAPLKKPNHDIKRGKQQRFRDKKQSDALTPQQPINNKRYKEEQRDNKQPQNNRHHNETNKRGDADNWRPQQQRNKKRLKKRVE